MGNGTSATQVGSMAGCRLPRWFGTTAWMQRTRRCSLGADVQTVCVFNSPEAKPGSVPVCNLHWQTGLDVNPLDRLVCHFVSRRPEARELKKSQEQAFLVEHPGLQPEIPVVRNPWP